MARIKPEDRTPDVTISIRLREDIARKLSAYAQFLDGSSIHYVVGAVLEQEFQSDKEFREWCTAHPEALSAQIATPGSNGPGRPKKAAHESKPNGVTTTGREGKTHAHAV
jgi:hypothetical protein